ncbi:MAG: hypothetical protein DRN19_02000 [Thermoplasmata archaeon]|nr:MAG: hypothetical protein DRN19_02000 [Thermoplasmata archaeon]
MGIFFSLPLLREDGYSCKIKVFVQKEGIYPNCTTKQIFQHPTTILIFKGTYCCFMTKSVMIVDEENEFSTKIVSLLKDFGVKVKSVKTSKEALEMLEKEESIYAVLLHTRLPDGKEVFVPFIRKEDETLSLGVEITKDCKEEDIKEMISRIVNV